MVLSFVRSQKQQSNQRSSTDVLRPPPARPTIGGPSAQHVAPESVARRFTRLMGLKSVDASQSQPRLQRACGMNLRQASWYPTKLLRRIRVVGERLALGRNRSEERTPPPKFGLHFAQLLAADHNGNGSQLLFPLKKVTKYTKWLLKNQPQSYPKLASIQKNLETALHGASPAQLLEQLQTEGSLFFLSNRSRHAIGVELIKQPNDTIDILIHNSGFLVNKGGHASWNHKKNYDKYKVKPLLVKGVRFGPGVHRLNERTLEGLQSHDTAPLIETYYHVNRMGRLASEAEMAHLPWQTVQKSGNCGLESVMAYMSSAIRRGEPGTHGTHLDGELEWLNFRTQLINDVAVEARKNKYDLHRQVKFVGHKVLNWLDPDVNSDASLKQEKLHWSLKERLNSMLESRNAKREALEARNDR